MMKQTRIHRDIETQIFRPVLKSHCKHVNKDVEFPGLGVNFSLVDLGRDIDQALYDSLQPLGLFTELPGREMWN